MVLGGFIAYVVVNGGIGSPNVAELLVGPLLVAGGARLGVLTAGDISTPRRAIRGA